MRERIPMLTFGGARYRLLGPLAFEVSWALNSGDELELLANLSPEPLTHDAEPSKHTFFEVNAVVEMGQLEAWSVRWRIL